MSVVVRPFRRGGWEVDIRTVLPDGTALRERKKAPVSSRSGALRWGQERERELLRGTATQSTRKAPRLHEIVPEFLSYRVEVERLDADGGWISKQESLLRCHLLPVLGEKRLDEIRNPDIDRVHAAMRHLSASMVRDAMITLNRIREFAVRRDYVPRDRVTFDARLPRKVETETHAHTFEDLERLLHAARELGPTHLLAVLLQAHASCRVGEAIGVRWDAVDLERRILHVRGQVRNGQAVATKTPAGVRRVPLTPSLLEALRGAWSRDRLRGEFVLHGASGEPRSKMSVDCLVKPALRRAALTTVRPNHTLRHTFRTLCLERWIPETVLDRWMGHRNRSMGARYSHEVAWPVQLDWIARLEAPAGVEPWRHVGDGGSSETQLTAAKAVGWGG